MAARDAPKPTQLYSRLSHAQQEEFTKVVIEKLRTLIGGYGELSVLAEYIAVMLQSSKPPDQIQSELAAFLQDQSAPFTDWLCEQLVKFVGEDDGPPADTKGEALLLRAVQDARQGAGVAPGKKQRGDRESRRAARLEKRSAAVAGAEATLTPRPHHRSRSRARRRRDGAEGGSRRRKEAVLTPNVEFLRDAYHQKSTADEGRPPAAQESAPPVDTRWHFRAEPTPAPPVWQGAAAHLSPARAPMGPPPGQHAAPAAQPGAAPHGAPAGPPQHGAAMRAPAGYGEHAAPARPKFYPPKKWKVARAGTVVRTTENLNSDEVQTLQEGEIVEQIAPPFKLKNGIVRIQIRHPSSPQFPNPIGWVTQDATAAGGPKFLEPGPEPMQRPSFRPTAPHAPSPWGGPPTWRPRPPGSPGMRPARPPAYGGSHGGLHQNLTWTPSSAKVNGPDLVTISG